MADNKKAVCGGFLVGDGLEFEGKTLKATSTGGTEDYTELENKPSINNVELNGNKTLEDLGIASKDDLDTVVESVDDIVDDIETIDTTLQQHNDKIAANSSRIDTFTHLPEGSTTGDAELADIRVGYDGKTYNSAGSAVREQVSGLKQDLIEVQKNTVYGEYQKKTVNNETVIMLTEKNVRNVKTDFTEQEVTIKGRNRFNLEDAVFTMSGYTSSNTVTKEENGIKIVSTTTSTTSSVYAKAQYTAEYDGIIYFSCDAFTDGDVRDIKTLLRKGGSTVETEYGIGRHVYCISVSAGDVIEFGFQSHNQTNKGNTVYYHNIMVSYGGLYDFVPYTADVKNKNTEQSYETIDLPTTQATYTNKSRNPAVGGYYQQINITIPSDSPSIPSVSTDIADIDSNLPVVLYSTLYNGTNGVGISAAGTLAIGIDGKSRADIIAYLTDNPSWIKYKLAGGQEVIVNITHDFRSGEIVEFTTAQELSYYYTPEKKKRKGICFGDSITGMFGYGADYPSIITRETDCNMVNAGFAGCRWTDHLTSGGNVDKYTPFCMNRLVDAIVSGDYSEQDASGKVNPSDSDFSQLYVDHLSNIKSFDFKSADVCTIYYGVNDWNSSAILKSADDPSTDNKQRSNVEDAVKYCIDKLLTAYPNMRIVVITPYWWGSTGEHGDSNVDPNSRNDYLRNYGAYIREIAENTFNVPTVDLYSTGANVYNARYFTRDLGHPTVMMKNIIARKIIEKIK